MKLRHPSPLDVPVLLDLAREAHAESWYADFAFDAGKAERTIHAALEADDALPLVVETANGQIAGFFLAAITEHYFSRCRFACDVVIYVAPAHRGGPAFAKMIQAYEAWCRIKGVEEVVLGFSSGSMGEKVSAMYRRLGYQQNATAWRKKCVWHN